MQTVSSGDKTSVRGRNPGLGLDSPWGYQRRLRKREPFELDLARQTVWGLV